ncbi:MAG: heparan-alpha-glucosaminide N-acetyltransferase domain-containing protein [Gemmatimonadaceae bacterium]
MPSSGVNATAAAGTASARLASLDVFRGLTVAGMLLVNDPGSWEHIYPPLEHAPWNGWTPTDLIFPFFLFIVGITTHLSTTARRARGATDGDLARAVLRRGALIFLAGFLLNAFPFFWWGGIPGFETPTFLTRIAWRWEHVRFLGVLQRIGLVYTAAGLLAIRATARQQYVVLATLLLGYWAVMTVVPVPGSGVPGWMVLDTPAATLEAWVDRVVLGANHIWTGSVTYDPEGLLSTLPAIGTAIAGLVAGRWIGTARPVNERIAGLLAGGSLAMVVGLIWNWGFPINKSLWTSSYVVFTAGMGATALGTCMWLIDAHRITWWTRPFLAFGVNPIAAFIGSGIVARCIYSIFTVPGPNGTPIALQAAIFNTLFASWLPPRPASLAFALAFVSVFLAVLTVMYRRNIILKI